MAQELLKVEHLSAAYGGIHALYDISLKSNPFGICIV